MKRKLSAMGIIMCFSFMVMFFALPVQAKKAALTVTKKVTIGVGESSTISVKKASGVKTKKITYRSRNKKIATVSSKGKITGKKKGSTKVKVTVKYKLKKKVYSKSYTVKVTVKKKKKKKAQQTPTIDPETGVVDFGKAEGVIDITKYVKDGFKIKFTCASKSVSLVYTTPATGKYCFGYASSLELVNVGLDHGEKSAWAVINENSLISQCVKDEEYCLYFSPDTDSTEVVVTGTIVEQDERYLNSITESDGKVIASVHNNTKSVDEKYILTGKGDVLKASSNYDGAGWEFTKSTNIEISNTFSNNQIENNGYYIFVNQDDKKLEIMLLDAIYEYEYE